MRSNALYYMTDEAAGVASSGSTDEHLVLIVTQLTSILLIPIYYSTQVLSAPLNLHHHPGSSSVQNPISTAIFWHASVLTFFKFNETVDVQKTPL